MFKNKKKWLIILGILISLAVIGIDIKSYTAYRNSLIKIEQKQLLTMARTIGNSLHHYILAELDKINLYYADVSDKSDAKLKQMLEYLSSQNGELYSWANIYDENGKLLFDGEYGYSSLLQEDAQNAKILGKHIGNSGWYNLFIEKDVQCANGKRKLLFALNLNEIFIKIVAPVKIGSGGYSVVKDQDLAIIMHHAKSQIGMDAIYDREQKYPDLDLSALSAWLKLQKVQDEGIGVLDTYIWDDADLSPIKRIVAFTKIDIQDERWIVNSTLPVNELQQPLAQMISVMISLTLLYFFILGIIGTIIARSFVTEEIQAKEIQYLKDINEGLEIVEKQKDEIRHYQRVQSLGMMASHIAHELNNYLTPVMVYTELLQNSEYTNDDDRQMLAEMMNSTERAAALAKDLLAFSRQDSGSNLKKMNLCAEVSQALNLIRQLTPKEVMLNISLDSGDAYIMARDGLMQHILMNLCKNAFQAMEASAKKSLEIRLHIKADKKEAVLTVKDSGLGIAKEKIAHIFEPFYTTKGSRQGTGLGLSVVRNLINSVGGNIEVKSEVGYGTLFCLTFPYMDKSQYAKKLPSIRAAFYVGLNQTRLKSLKKLLNASPVQWYFFDHSAGMVSKLKQNPNGCQLVIAEEEQHGMSGLELLAIVEKLNPEIRKILAVESMDSRLEWYSKNRIIDRIVSYDDLEKGLKSIIPNIVYNPP